MLCNYVFYRWVIKKFYNPTKFDTLMFEEIKEIFLLEDFGFLCAKCRNL